jgi:transposase
MKCLFIPPTSPDYNPTKQAKSSITSAISTDQNSLAEAGNKERVEEIIHHIVCGISREQAWEWFRECNYA